jgi:Mg-chelatase subunit ChlD
MLHGTQLFRLGAAVLTTALLAGGAGAQQAANQPRPQVEVVFCLDTTGSMSGLIDAAKKKIWAISNQIATGTPSPQVKVGLVAYRDRGDAYVTKVIDLTDDLDAIHTQLMSFQAAGGGDFPESVNQALHESVTRISWSKDKKTLKLIFLVGDAPPHMDYPDDVKYPETCKLAVQRDIIINTVQCGNHAETKKYWVDICRLAEGSYVQIDAQGGPVVVVETPFDKDLAKINNDLAGKVLVFGDAKTQAKGKAQQEANKKLAAPVAADRAGFYANAHRAESYDLLENIKKGTVKLEELKKEQLPSELRSLTLAQQKECLDKLDKERGDLLEKARDLDKKRTAFIADKMKADLKNRPGDSFDGQVLQLLQRQATRANIQYGNVEKKK